MNEIMVGMGEIALGSDGDMLVSLGLGSCVAVILYDPAKRIGGMAHIMLPDSMKGEFKHPPRRVLIAEHDAIIRGNIRTILLNHQFEIVAEPKEKAEAIHLYRQMGPAIALVSAFLPPTNGADAVDEIMGLDKSAKVIVLSPTLEREVLLSYLQRGAEEVITNPFTEPKVVGSVEYVLYKRLLKFADRAIPVLINKMVGLGADRKSIVAKLAGGAHMFPTMIDDETMQIGRRNAEAARTILAKNGIRILCEEIGSNVGRTVRFDVGAARVEVKTKDGTRPL